MKLVCFCPYLAWMSNHLSQFSHYIQTETKHKWNSVAALIAQPCFHAGSTPGCHTKRPAHQCSGSTVPRDAKHEIVYVQVVLVLRRSLLGIQATTTPVMNTKQFCAFLRQWVLTIAKQLKMLYVHQDFCPNILHAHLKASSSVTEAGAMSSIEVGMSCLVQALCSTSSPWYWSLYCILCCQMCSYVLSKVMDKIVLLKKSTITFVMSAVYFWDRYHPS